MVTHMHLEPPELSSRGRCRPRLPDWPHEAWSDTRTSGRESKIALLQEQWQFLSGVFDIYSSPSPPPPPHPQNKQLCCLWWALLTSSAHSNSKSGGPYKWWIVVLSVWLVAIFTMEKFSLPSVVKSMIYCLIAKIGDDRIVHDSSSGDNYINTTVF